MKSHVFTFLFLFLGYFGFAQETKKDSTVIYYLIGNDSILRSSLELDEVVVTGKSRNKAEEDRRKFLLLQRRVLKVYPYAKSGADNLTMLNNNMAKLKTEKEKKKYFKIVEKYLEKEFEGQLKKLSRKEGQILVKLIHRQTGKSTFTLIKDLKSGWKAFWSNNTAKLFDIDLKTEFKPFDVTEDFLIESILIKAFNDGRLQRQPAAIAIDYTELSKTWKDKVEQSKKE
ncbi:DUF4294 domain-containing protein [Flavobacterium sp. UBA6135]|uniref:DUF4294 domain-containing protein n=1 Tax=Flavobacterium sp. UBA6135 TaxID=1946553 RepID=UPI0025B9019F|nr:DUF4294 domain-containing protein [Flavobacterium sp. UBA6135]